MLDWRSPLLDPGTPAPEFDLLDHQGSSVKLSGLRGRNVMLVFYPADDTSICTKQLCEFRDRWPLVQQKNTVVFGVNPAKVATHAKFRDRHQFPFPILSDPGQRTGSSYRAKGLFAPRRTVYLIGPDGMIRYARRGKPEPEEVLSAAV